MIYLKTYEQKSIFENVYSIDDIRYDLLVVDDYDLLTYEYNENMEYKQYGPLSFDDYVTEILLNNSCKFYCNKCSTYHTGKVDEIDIFDPAAFNNEEPNGPWVKIKISIDGEIVESVDDNFHDIDPYSQFTVFGEQSELLKKYNRIRSEISEFKPEISKFNL
jgi:hypothetical protein